MASARVSFPSQVRRMIQNIKEIAGGHTDEEVYAALRECNMDPNETVQNLLRQDTFHEVKRKREKKRESIKESAEFRWRPGAQGRGGKGGRGGYSSRQVSNSSDLTGKNVIAGKENGVNPDMAKCSSSSPANPNADTKTPTSILSLSGALSNGPFQHVAPEKTSLGIGHLPTSDSKGLVDVKGTPEDVALESGSDVCQSSIQPPTSISGACTLALDPAPTPSLEVDSHSEISAAKHAFGTQCAAGENKMSSDDVSTVPKDTSQPSCLSSIALPGSRPSSSYSSHSQQLNGSQKGIPNKEWKPKSTNKPTQAEIIMHDDVPATVETVSQPALVPNSAHQEDISLKMDKSMQLSYKQHVIIPDHLQVTESEKYGLSFGSFGTSFEQTVGLSKDPEKYGLRFGSFVTSFEQTVGLPKDPESDQSSSPPEYESFQVDEVADEPAASHQDASSTGQKADEPGLFQLPVEMTDDMSRLEVDNSSSTPEAAESDQSKDAAAAASHIPQDLVQNTSFSTFALAPQAQGNQIPLLETSESQVQQPNDFSASYYTQLYRPIADADGRLSPFTAPGAGIKYGNISVLPAQNAQTQEAVNSLVMSSSGSTPLATPSSGVVPSSIAIPQPPVPVFRQPLGVHLPHYQPGFIPYNQYMPPFYVPPHALHHFMGNTVFPQSPSTGSMYPPVSAAAAPSKYSTTAYKPGANPGSQTHALTPGVYGTYGSSAPIYSNNTVVASGTSTENDDVSGSQFKENNVYISGQQSEGSTVWIPGRDVSGLHSSTFYGLPPQGQHLAFAPAQGGHGAYGGMYHPAQTMSGATVHPLLQPSQTIAGAVEMVGPPANGYQQPQRAQMNWGNY